jgi:uncharacterized membrane protein (UPF0182 family)
MGSILLAVILLFAAMGKYLDWLWFKSMGTTAVFWASLLTGPVTKLALGILIFGFFYLNFRFAQRAFQRFRNVSSYWSAAPPKYISLIGVLGCITLTLVMVYAFRIDWTAIQQFIHQVTTGQTDPVFKKDLGFYMFSYPLLRHFQQLTGVILIITVIAFGLFYIWAKAFWRQGWTWEVWPPAKNHLTILVLFLALDGIWGYSLAKYGLLFQKTARLTGVNYTALHAKVFAYTALEWMLIGIIVVLIYSFFRRGYKLLVQCLAAWLVCAIILTGIVPMVVQAVTVNPNEYELEKPYLENHLRFTRQAYGLDQIKTEQFNIADTARAIPRVSHPALGDLRLWDYQPLLPAYNQLQAIRPYYQFDDLDIDRYPSAPGPRQVMIGVRELKSEGLPEQAKSWINLHLIYTHGLGVAANQVNQYTRQGQPVFIARDLPPRTAPEFPDLMLTQPEIYFGESGNQYIIVNTKTPEYTAQENQAPGYIYQGKQGIPLNSSLHRALFAVKFRDPNLLLSTQLTSKSLLLMNRNISDRVRRLAPFLRYDQDPYPVVSGGKIYWIIDAYCTNQYYPYSKPTRSGFNYIRNSVKVTIDAYDGSVNFWITAPADPVIQVWQKAFPELFKPASQIPPDLAGHFRYPELLLTVQREILAQYHMSGPRAFYEKEDYWDLPQGDDGAALEPYFVTQKLPGENKTEFLLLQPFVPYNKQNLAAWLFARCDSPNYGELRLYSLPKDQNIYGPAQIDSRINQDPNISQLVTLWNQHRSKVLWGKLLMIPLEDSVLYVKPLYLESENTGQAELKKIIVVFQDQVLIGDTLAQALAGITARNSRDSNIITSPALEEENARQMDIFKRYEETIKEQQRLIEEIRKLEF